MSATKEQAQQIINELIKNLEENRASIKKRIEVLADKHSIEVYLQDDHYRSETYYPVGANPYWNESGCSWADSDTDIAESEGQWLSSSEQC